MFLTPDQRRWSRQTGVSLIELMVGITVGLIVLWGLSSVYLNSSRGSRTTAAQNQLNQDLRAVMDIMVNDIRRAGYWGTATTGTNPFTATATNIQISGNCILYSYDATYAGGTAGSADAGTDFFGFRLSNGIVQTLDPTVLIASTATATCTNDAAWQNLTDERALTVTALTFYTAGSKCIAFNPATYDESDQTGTSTPWTVSNAVYTGNACDATTADASDRPATVPSDRTSEVETRQVVITLSATSKSTGDTALAGSLTETVLVRNNRLP